MATAATKMGVPASDPMPKEAQGAVDVSRRRWIVNKWIDILFVTGGLMWILIGVHYFVFGESTSPTGLGIPVLLVVLTHLFSNTHTMATWVRITWTEEDRKRFKFYHTVLLIPFIALCFVGFYSREWSAIFVKVYMLWVLQHYVSQSYGISLIYCFKQKYPVDKTFKWALKYLFLAMALYSAVRQLTYRRFSRSFFSGLELPFWGPLPEWVFFIVQTVTFALFAFNFYLWIKIWFETKKLPPLPTILLLVSTAFFMVAEGYFFALVWVYGPPLFHGSQYVAVAAAYHFKGQSLNKNKAIKKVRESVFSSSGVFYFLLLLMGGVFIYRGVPGILAEMRIPHLNALATTFAIVNFHHFVTDRAIWRIRDPKTREILLA